MALASVEGRIYVSDAGEHVGEDVWVFGWLYHRRDKGKLQFLLVRDGSGIIQCVVSHADVDEKTWALAAEVTQESSLKVYGTVRQDARAPGGYELLVKALEIVQIAKDYPITPKEHGVDFLMDHRHLWLRSSRQQAILRVRHEIVRAIRDFFDERGFVLLDAPIFTPAACEGTTTLFETDYFGQKVYLTQSGQLYMEAGAMAFGKVYCFGPAFRAERSKTRRHLIEFWMVEPEVAYFDLEDDMRLAEELVEYLVQRVLERRRAELETLGRDLAPLEKIRTPFPRISYDEAARILEEAGTGFRFGDDFGGTDETVLSERFERPVIVHRYPAAVKAFYMKNDPEQPDRALCMDMLAPEGYGEIIGGGQREDDLEALERKIEQHKLPRKAFEWYLDLRRYGSVPHAGFGLGIERTVAWICGLSHVRETIPFPRMLYRLEP
ncbi:MAG: asparagine--tRNA ligase [candidate division KSB1 bacterium]|nr:asparagine--tRNA ligase [candidate division KSB1 bacterium]